MTNETITLLANIALTLSVIVALAFGVADTHSYTRPTGAAYPRGFKEFSNTRIC